MTLAVQGGILGQHPRKPKGIRGECGRSQCLFASDPHSVTGRTVVVYTFKLRETSKALNTTSGPKGYNREVSWARAAQRLWFATTLTRVSVTTSEMHLAQSAQWTIRSQVSTEGSNAERRLWGPEEGCSSSTKCKWCASFG